MVEVTRVLALQRRRRQRAVSRDVVVAGDVVVVMLLIFGLLENRPDRLLLEQAADFPLQAGALGSFHERGVDPVVCFVLPEAAVAEALRDGGIWIELGDELAHALVPAQGSDDVVGQGFDAL